MTQEGATQDREWAAEAVRRIEADFNRSSDTHLLRVEAPGLSGVDIYLKDESTHPTGSLKHRLARSLFLHALCNGWIGPETAIIEASSGSTAVSEAYFARMLGLRFLAVMPRTTSAEKIAQIAHHGGESWFVDCPLDMYAEAARLARELNGRFLDQFTYAERATDWRGNNNIADSIFQQMRHERHPVPAWLVVGAGTGGTSATLGRYARYRRLPTRLCLADPEGSVFHRHVADREVCAAPPGGILVEGVGRPRCEPSFVPELIDRAVALPDALSIGAARVLSRRIGRACGGSTGLNMWVAAELAQDMARRGEAGSIVTLLCDSGERYRSTIFDDAWLGGQGVDTAPAERAFEAFLETGKIARPS